jgi:hypothetical protein
MGVSITKIEIYFWSFGLLLSFYTALDAKGLIHFLGAGRVQPSQGMLSFLKTVAMVCAVGLGYRLGVLIGR